jgi:predicted anti-sigma-YlaC factor YlaD
MIACDIGRERVHAHLDETPGAALSESLSLHFATCPGCRELYEDLVALRAALRARPRPELPADALEAVWERTVRRPAAGWLDGWRRAAAAAVLVTAVSASTLWLLRGSPAPAGPTPAQIALAEAQADLVLSYAARAIQATRTATTHRVVGSKISPAVRGDVPSDSRRR